MILLTSRPELDDVKLKALGLGIKYIIWTTRLDVKQNLSDELGQYVAIKIMQLKHK